MAERRMFAKKITESDSFLDMPMSTQALYFHLNMSADDDGFVNNPKKIQRMVGASDDDVKILIAKRFILIFESGIIVIKHWKMHNYIQSDRYRPTDYIDEKSKLELKNNKSYTFKNDNVYNLDTESVQDVSVGKVRIGKDRLGKVREEEVREEISSTKVDYRRILNSFNSICISFPKVQKLSDARKKAIKARFNTGYTYDDFDKLFTLTENSSFLKGNNEKKWQATFDWLIKDANIAKVLDGNYNDKGIIEPASTASYDWKKYAEKARGPLIYKKRDIGELDEDSN